jgi:hypothetical protein
MSNTCQNSTAVDCIVSSILHLSEEDKADQKLYSHYVQYMEDAGRHIMSLLRNEKCLQWYRETHRTMSREEFMGLIKTFKNSPERKKSLEKLLCNGFRTEVSTQETARWKSLITQNLK